MKAVIYARFSSHSQRDESIDGQVREATEFAKKNAMDVVGVYTDRAISGKTDNRAEFQRMIKDSEKGLFEIVICYKLDRFARNRYDSAMYKARLKKHGVKVVYAKEPIPDGPEGIILESVLEGFAEYYSASLSVNIRRGIMENALQCKVTSACMPLGYDVGADKHYQINKDEAPIVRKIFEMYVDGCNFTQIADALNSKGFVTKTGSKFNKNSFRTLLANERYVGVFTYKDIRVEDGIPAIVDKDLFYKAQERTRLNRQAPARSKAIVEYLLTTKVFCGYCGSPMVGESGTGKSGKKYNYYTCTKRKRKHTCNKKPITKNLLEKIVIENTINQVLQENVLDYIAQSAADLLERERNDNSYLLSLQSQLADVKKALKNITTAIEEGIFTSTTKNRLIELETQKADLELSVLEEEISKPVVGKEHIFFWLAQFKNGNIEDPDYCKTLIDTFINAIYIFDDKLIITYNYTEQNDKTTLTAMTAALSEPAPTANCKGSDLEGDSP